MEKIYKQEAFGEPKHLYVHDFDTRCHLTKTVSKSISSPASVLTERKTDRQTYRQIQTHTNITPPRFQGDQLHERNFSWI